VDNIEASNMLFTVNNDTSTTHVTTTGNYDDVTGIKGDKVSDFALFEVELHSVVDLDGGIRVADRAPVMSDDVRDTLGAEGHFANFEKFVGGFLGGDAMNSESPLHIV